MAINNRQRTINDKNHFIDASIEWILLNKIIKIKSAIIIRSNNK